MIDIHFKYKSLNLLRIWFIVMMIGFPVGCESSSSDDAPATQNTSSDSQPPAVSGIPVFSYRIIRAYPHDPEAFTQGLIYENGKMFESTGLNGRSSLREVDLETGKVLRILNLDNSLFGEGIALINNKIFQITWLSQKGFVYNPQTFDLLEEFDYPTEGWGLTHDGKRLILSDGTSTLHFHSPDDFSETGALQVSDDKGPVDKLNELEYINGEIYANVWLTHRIAIISPQTGKVTGWINLEGLLPNTGTPRKIGELNGIAYDKEKKRLFVTGKLWPQLFEIELIPGNIK